jgi:predicted nucleotidyltransferase
MISDNNDDESIGMKKDLAILKELKTLLIKHFNENIDKVILFGSRANGKANKDSDYDIVIILNNDYDWRYRNRIYDIIFDLEIDKGVFFDIHIISKNELNNTMRGAEPIFVNALEKGVYI